MGNIPKTNYRPETANIQQLRLISQQVRDFRLWIFTGPLNRQLVKLFEEATELQLKLALRIREHEQA